jgi:Domain of unknown function (DUF4440)
MNRMDATRKAQIIASEQNLLEAMRTNDVDRLDQLLHDQLLFNGPTGETVTKAMDLTNYRSGNINLHTLEASDQVLSSIEDDVVVAVTVEIQGNYLGQEINGKFRYLRVWKLFENTWKVFAGSVVTII